MSRTKTEQNDGVIQNLSTKTTFRGKSIDLDIVVANFAPSDTAKRYEALWRKLSKLNNTLEERLIKSLALEQWLSVFSEKVFEDDDGSTEPSPEDIETEIETLFHRVGPAKEILIPLFFNNDLTSAASHFFKNRNVRDIAYRKFHRLCSDNGFTQTALTENYYNTCDTEWAYFPVVAEFEQIAFAHRNERNKKEWEEQNEAWKKSLSKKQLEDLELQKALHRDAQYESSIGRQERLKEETNSAEVRTKQQAQVTNLSGLIAGLFFGAIGGPFAYLVLLQRDFRGKEGFQMQMIGVTIATLVWVGIATGAINLD